MANIRIERTPIEYMYLGLTGADHLMLLYQQTEGESFADQGSWLLINGTMDQSGPNVALVGVEGAMGNVTLMSAYGALSEADLYLRIGTPATRGSKILPSTDPQRDWGFMKLAGFDIEQQDFPYIAFSPSLTPYPTANSSSVAASLLFYLGIDINQNMPSSMPWRYTAGLATLFGSSQDDMLTLPETFNTLLSGDGNDTLKGSDESLRLEKFYSGSGNDLFTWSRGTHIYHGGQPRLDYGRDGDDTVDYTGVNAMHIERGSFPVPHQTADFIVTRDDGGIDQLFSIEVIRYSPGSDTVTLGEGVALSAEPILFEFQGEEGSGKGDSLDLSGERNGVLLLPSDEPEIVRVSAEGNDGSGRGVWLQSLEWVTGSHKDDRLYAGPILRGLDGGEGNDVLSGRKAEAFTGVSPQGYDIELAGGNGDDILVSGAGRTRVSGGEGRDTFVLSSLSDLSSSSGPVEFIIDDASSEDRLLVPYNFIKPYYTSVFEGSLLLPILGGMSWDDTASFATLPEHGSSSPLGMVNGGFYLEHKRNDQFGQGTSPSDGVIEMYGDIGFNRDGADLLIHIYAGEMGTLYDGTPELFQLTQTETIIRVRGFEDGDLGIWFYTAGEITGYINVGGQELPFYENWDAAVDAMTNNGVLLAALAAEPETPVYDGPALDGQRDDRDKQTGDDEDNIIVSSLTAPAPLQTLTRAAAELGYASGSDLEGRGGNDTLTGSAKRDTLDGGTGADRMSGGRGNDLYLVDDPGDIVTELVGGGLDTVESRISYALPDHVEILILTGTGGTGDGNSLDNTLTGSAGADALSGLDGSDRLHGGPGNDRLDGGAGADVFAYFLGDGIDTIADSSLCDIDSLYLGGMEASSVGLFLASDLSSSLILRMMDGGRVILEDFVEGYSADEVIFDDWTVWTREELTSRAKMAPVLLNDAPVARPDGEFYTNAPETIISAAILLENDSDFDGDELSLSAVASVTDGTTVGLTQTGDVRVTMGGVRPVSSRSRIRFPMAMGDRPPARPPFPSSATRRRPLRTPDLRTRPRARARRGSSACRPRRSSMLTPIGSNSRRASQGAGRCRGG